jgi:DNA-binding GntR family transcriptional regulator
MHDADRAELIMREHIYEARDILVARMQSNDAAEAAEASAVAGGETP